MAKLLCACGLGDFSGANPNNNRIPTISKTKPILTQHSPGERCSTGNPMDRTILLTDSATAY